MPIFRDLCGILQKVSNFAAIFPTRTSRALLAKDLEIDECKSLQSSHYRQMIWGFFAHKSINIS